MSRLTMGKDLFENLNIWKFKGKLTEVQHYQPRKKTEEKGFLFHNGKVTKSLKKINRHNNQGSLGNDTEGEEDEEEADFTVLHYPISSPFKVLASMNRTPERTRTLANLEEQTLDLTSGDGRMRNACAWVSSPGNRVNSGSPSHALPGSPSLRMSPLATSRHFSEYSENQDNKLIRDRAAFRGFNYEQEAYEEPHYTSVSKHLTSSPYRAEKLDLNQLDKVSAALKNQESRDHITVHHHYDEEYFIYGGDPSSPPNEGHITLHADMDSIESDDDENAYSNTRSYTVNESRKAFELQCTRQLHDGVSRRKNEGLGKQKQSLEDSEVTTQVLMQEQNKEIQARNQTICDEVVAIGSDGDQNEDSDPDTDVQRKVQVNRHLRSFRSYPQSGGDEEEQRYSGPGFGRLNTTYPYLMTQMHKSEPEQFVEFAQLKPRTSSDFPDRYVGRDHQKGPPFGADLDQRKLKASSSQLLDPNNWNGGREQFNRMPPGKLISQEKHHSKKSRKDVNGNPLELGLSRDTLRESSNPEFFSKIGSSCFPRGLAHMDISNADTPISHHTTTTGMTGNNRRRKKQEKEKIVDAATIPGNRGNQQVDELLAFIENTETSTATNTTKKNKKGSTSIPHEEGTAKKKISRKKKPKTTNPAALPRSGSLGEIKDSASDGASSAMSDLVTVSNGLVEIDAPVTVQAKTTNVDKAFVEKVQPETFNVEEVFAEDTDEAPAPVQDDFQPVSGKKKRRQKTGPTDGAAPHSDNEKQLKKENRVNGGRESPDESISCSSSKSSASATKDEGKVEVTQKRRNSTGNSGMSEAEAKYDSEPESCKSVPTDAKQAVTTVENKTYPSSSDLVDSSNSSLEKITIDAALDTTVTAAVTSWDVEETFALPAPPEPSPSPPNEKAFEPVTKKDNWKHSHRSNLQGAPRPTKVFTPSSGAYGRSNYRPDPRNSDRNYAESAQRPRSSANTYRGSLDRKPVPDTSSTKDFPPISSSGPNVAPGQSHDWMKNSHTSATYKNRPKSATNADAHYATFEQTVTETISLFVEDKEPVTAPSKPAAEPQKESIVEDAAVTKQPMSLAQVPSNDLPPPPPLTQAPPVPVPVQTHPAVARKPKARVTNQSGGIVFLDSKLAQPSVDYGISFGFDAADDGAEVACGDGSAAAAVKPNGPTARKEQVLPNGFVQCDNPNLSAAAAASQVHLHRDNVNMDNVARKQVNRDPRFAQFKRPPRNEDPMYKPGHYQVDKAINIFRNDFAKVMDMYERGVEGVIKHQSRGDIYKNKL